MLRSNFLGNTTEVVRCFSGVEMLTEIIFEYYGMIGYKINYSVEIPGVDEPIVVRPAELRMVRFLFSGDSEEQLLEYQIDNNKVVTNRTEYLTSFEFVETYIEIVEELFGKEISDAILILEN